ncbi:MAG TPA: hypothetical protein DDZ88_11735 [Verrucomicrobiales bacterium]|nr:hypothetical protein [Verrucomicrobiales bacterium]
MHEKDSSGNSIAQNEAEPHFRALLLPELGELNPCCIQLPDGSSVQIDGSNSQQSILVEIFARQGSLLDGQKKKAARDILKLAMLKRLKPNRRVIFCYANEKLDKHLKGASWLAHAAATFQVELIDVSDRLPEKVKALLIKTQSEQAKNRRKA